MGKIWVRPSLGLFFGLVNANKHQGDDSKANGGLIIGNFAVQLGGLLGGLVGFGENFGLYTGINGALAFLPFLGFGFVGIPVGIHFKKKWGIGLIIPVWITQWWIGLIIGIIAFLIATAIARKK